MNPTPTDSGEEDLRLDHGADARISLWWTHVPPLAGERLGAIGQFSASSEDAAVRILAAAEAELRKRDCTLAVGPMDGNTWRRHRFVTERGSEPPFFLEPTNPDEWPLWWRSAGYTPLAQYYSAVTDDLTTRDPRLDAASARMIASGTAIRSINPAHFDQELRRIHELSLVAFRDNFLYTPLPESSFLTQYRQIQERLIPDLVLLAERAGQLVGYVFAVPDYAQELRREPITTIIVKTLAVLPERANAGLGALLLGNVHDAGRCLGFKRAIHALMHESNKSLNLSARYGHAIRRYTLFAKRLAT